MFDIHYTDDNGESCITYAGNYEQAAAVAIALSRRYEYALVIGFDFQDSYEYGHHAERIYCNQED